MFGQQLLLKRIKKNQRNSGVWAPTGTCSLVATCWLPPAGGKLACWLATGSAEWLVGLTAHCLLWMGTYLFDPLGESTGGLAAWLWLAGRKQTYFSFRFSHEQNKTRLIGRCHIYVYIYIYRRLGEGAWPTQPGNRFVSFVRACCPCEVGSE